MNLSSPSEIKALLQKNGFNFSKALGQNFLINPSVCPRMAEAAIPGPEYGVIEVGPGIGVLTVELAQRAQKVIAIELDERLYPILDETLADYPNAHVVPGDILEVDLTRPGTRSSMSPARPVSCPSSSARTCLTTSPLRSS